MADAHALVDVLLQLRQIPEPTKPTPQTQPTPDPHTSPPINTPTRTTPTHLPPWTGPIAPAHDPRIARVNWSGHPFAKGKPWNIDEDIALRTAFNEGANLLELARAHGRTPTALALRLERQGLIAPNHPYSQNRRKS
jgi:hypothetical protein